MRRCAMVALSAVLSFGCISQEEQQPDDRLVGTKWEARDYPYEEKTGVAPAYNIFPGSGGFYPYDERMKQDKE